MKELAFISTCKLKKIVFPLLLVLAFALAGCGQSGSLGDVNREKGVVSVSVSVPKAISQGSLFAVDLTNGQSTFHGEQILNGATATAVLTGVFVGPWDVNAYIVDADGSKTHVGNTKVLVNAGATSTCSLKLIMNKGDLNLNIDKESLDSDVAYGKLKLGLSPDYISDLRSDKAEDGSLSFTVQNLSPTTYQYKVELYDKEDRLLYSSPSELVEVKPGKPSNVSWAPPVGQVSVAGTVDSSPDAPRGVRYSYIGSRLDISWDVVQSSEDDICGYWIYRKIGDLGEYSLIGNVNFDKFVYSSPKPTTPGTYYYRISCYDLNGNESSWSDEVKVTI